MKMTGLMKRRNEETAGRNEMRGIVVGAGMELDDNELDNVIGGVNVYDTEITEVKVWKSYTIRKGESLAEIAAKYQVTILTLMKHNHLASAASIKAGMTIQVPMK